VYVVTGWAIAGDIEQMFHNCIIAKEEAKYKRDYAGMDGNQDILRMRIWLAGKSDLRQIISISGGNFVPHDALVSCEKKCLRNSHFPHIIAGTEPYEVYR
jgi:hypothetical protein